jgi:hypothetical protein
VSEHETNAATSAPAADSRLQIQLEIRPGVVMDRIPTRTAALRFTNKTKEPLRIYLPNEVARASISTITMTASGGRPLFIPDLHPHGYVVTEADFPLLAPGETREFTQSFSLDPMKPGPGTATERRKGFEAGKSVRVDWTYDSSVRRWPGGVATFGGPTRELFDGGDVPYIWTGKLHVEMTWTVPK